MCEPNLTNIFHKEIIFQQVHMWYNSEIMWVQNWFL